MVCSRISTIFTGGLQELRKTRWWPRGADPANALFLDFDALKAPP
jgi:hypothetical protein